MRDEKEKMEPVPLFFDQATTAKQFPFQQGYQFPPDCWSKTKREVKKNFEGISSVSRLNNLLAKKKTELRDRIHKLGEDDILQSLSIVKLKSALTRPIL